MLKNWSGLFLFRKKSLSSRLSRATIFVEIITILIVGLGLVLIADRALEEYVIRLQKKTADNISGHISSYITDAVNDLQMFEICNTSEPEDFTRQKQLLDNMVVYRGTLFSQISLIDYNGHERIRISRYHTYLKNELRKLDNSDIFKKASAGETYISPVFISPESGLLSMQIAIRIKIRGYLYVLFTEINITRLWQEISEIKTGTTGYAYLVDRSGRYIASQSSADILQNYGKDVSGIPPVNAYIHRRAESDLCTKSYNGVGNRPVIGVFSPIDNTEWAVIVELPSSEAFEGVTKMMIYLVGLMLLGLVLAGASGYVISGRIVGHLNRLTSAAMDIGKGNLDVKIPGQELDDEVGVLAGTMNRMQGELKELYKNLHIQLAELRSAQKALSESEKTVKAVFENAYQFIGLMNTDGTLLEANHAALAFLNISKSEVIGKPFWEGPWWSHSRELQDKLRESIDRAAGGEFIRFEATHLDFNGKVHYVDFSIKPVFDDDNKVILLIPEGRDITERKEAEEVRLKLEDRFRQIQKMESITNLASGIAHDFNNVLGGIVGTISLMKYNLEKNREMDSGFIKEKISVIETAADRAKDIVRQLLTLSRKQDYQLMPVDINVSVENVLRLCRNSFDKSIEINSRYCEGSAMVNADSSQVEQVLLNVCINSAHAMTIMRRKNEHIGGVLSVETGIIDCDRVFYETHPEARYERYVIISIYDTGVGMNKDTVAKMFDPFFTTKDKENGSGLGLSMVYNIVNDHNGFIDVYSEAGTGTTFNIFFPYYEDTGNTVSAAAEENIYRGTGLVLVVDDEDIIRNIASEILIECGYEVLLAENGSSGIELLRESGDKISLVILDMAMPGMSGKETYIEMKKIKPDIKVILSSGFKQDKRVLESMELGINTFIQKPYTIYNLSKTVYLTLNS